jgi:anti-sigma B factor antagonist
MATADLGQAALRLTTATPRPGVALVEVEGDLEEHSLERWSRLLDSAVEDGATGIAIDLRGCRKVDSACLSLLLSASAKLKARGGGGINLVTNRGSLLEREVGTAFPVGLPAFRSAADALLSLATAADRQPGQHLDSSHLGGGIPMGTSVRFREDGALSLHVEPDGDVIVVRAFGEIDIATAEGLEDELRNVLGRDGATVHLDLAHVDFIDSTGLRALLSVAKYSHSHGGGLRMRRGSGAVDRTIKLAGVEGVLPLVP